MSPFNAKSRADTYVMPLILGSTTYALSLGIRQKPLTYKPWGYAISCAGFFALSMMLDGLRLKQNAFVQDRVQLLNDERARRGVSFERS